MLPWLRLQQQFDLSVHDGLSKLYHVPDDYQVGWRVRVRRNHDICLW